MSTLTAAHYQLHPLIAERWSPRAFENRPVETWKVCSMLEAARWAPSCFNEQPWRFFVGSTEVNPDIHQRLQSLLVSGNDWAKKAPVLLLSVAKLDFTQTGKPNRHAYHDVGLAMENLTIQAMAMDLYVHQMGGFHFEKAREEFGIPRSYDPVAMAAIGYKGSPDLLDKELRERELSPRERKPLQEIAFSHYWGSTYPACFT